MAKPESLNFTVDGQLIGELGERLVTRNHVALSELIKNGYDADATEISVGFLRMENLSAESVPSIKIEDNGSGMSFAEVKANWMRIATANKQRDDVSEMFGRPRTGSKGIGRFSCQRLAEELVLITTTASKTGFNQVIVNFKWSDFIPGSNLTDIPCTFKKRRLKQAKVGTVLCLMGLRDDWTGRDYDTLRRSVVTLAFAQETKRKGYYQDPGLTIKLEGANFQSGSGDLLEDIIESGWGRLKGTIDATGRLLLKLNGKYLRSPCEYTSNPLYKEFYGVEFDLSYFVGQESYFMNRDTNTLKKNVLYQLRKEAGVRVYFERFRVFPLGEPGNDWLLLDRDYAARKSSTDFHPIKEIAESLNLNVRDVALLRPRNENLLGRVFLSKLHEKHLQIKMNREGFIDSEAFRKLSGLVRFSVEWMSAHYAYAKSIHARSERSEAEREFSESVSVAYKSNNGGDASPVEKAVEFLAKAAIAKTNSAFEVTDDLPANVSRAEDVIRLNYRDLNEEIGILRTLASTAPLLFTFSHEVHALIGRLDTHAGLIKGINKRLRNKDDKRRLNAIANDMTETGSQFRELSNLFGIIANTKDVAKKRYYIRPLLDNLIAGTKFTTKTSGIEVTVTCTDDLKTPPIRRSEFISIIINLYTNALKSTIAGNGDKIEISCSYRQDFLNIEVMDTGVGLGNEFRKEVFNPFASDPENKIYRHLEEKIGGTTVSSLGRGTGLGLSIVKGLVETNKGGVEFFDLAPWSIGVRVKLPG